MKPASPLYLLGALALAGALAGPAHAQAPAAPSPAKICADRWNEMKATNQTGEQSFRDFSAQCLKEPGAAQEKPATAGEAAPAPKRNTTPTGASAAAAQPSIKQCADLWNEMKAKNQTGTRTYRDFAQECLAGTGVLDDKPAQTPAETPAGSKDAANPSQGAPPKTSVPSVPRPAAAPAPDPAPSLSRPPDASDREALNRCNAEWQAYKARHNLTGAKAWHVFMARCLP
ncbi:hypothetical protein [Ancylobacter rudongensis]|uniref:PsiF repeat-containing protein n=1 Tax=Ancylobacter rudongensis TaxID=177413 RepID=A0A1G4URJ5_9HYPH|nr:hypothetical protein [Ancylobacter rudongensis]SCW96144.1 hypothetical protein SAMN05660859_0172 [Ancylobacter rudongensis]